MLVNVLNIRICAVWKTYNSHLSIWKLVYVHSEVTPVSANHVAIFRDVTQSLNYVTSKNWNDKSTRTNTIIWVSSSKSTQIYVTAISLCWYLVGWYTWKVSVLNSPPGRKCRAVDSSVPPHGCQTALQKRHARVKPAAQRVHKTISSC